MSTIRTPSDFADHFAARLREAVEAARAVVNGDGTALTAIASQSPDLSSAFAASAMVIVWLLQQPYLTVAQQNELLETAHHALLTQFLETGPGAVTNDLDTVLGGILREPDRG